MKCESILKIPSLKTEVMFIKKCCVKKTIKKTPERAIAIFLPIEELKSLFIVKFQSTKLTHNEITNKNL